MKIETKFNIGDKVWYYIEEMNQYSWGKIESIEAKTISKFGKIRASYFVNNRHFRVKGYHEYLCTRADRFDDHRELKFEEKEIFRTSETLEESLIQKSMGKIKRMTELKKGWFG